MGYGHYKRQAPACVLKKKKKKKDRTEVDR